MKKDAKKAAKDAEIKKPRRELIPKHLRKKPGPKPKPKAPKPPPPPPPEDLRVFEPITVDGKDVEVEVPVVINGVPFKKNPECNYRHDYYAEVARIALSQSGVVEKDTYRRLMLDDLWFWVAFVMKVPMKIINHPFVVQACNDVMEGPKERALYVWARGHFKTTIITMADTLRHLVAYPEDRQVLFAYTRPLALKVLRQIKVLSETSDFLKDIWDDVFYRNPKSESPKWAEEVGGGLTFKRKASSKECSLEAYGLIEGMPTGGHYNRRVYDDIVTEDLVKTPEMVQQVKDTFDLSLNLGPMSEDENDVVKILGTYYRHDDVLVYITNKTLSTGEKMYPLIKKPATADGTFNGVPVYISEKLLQELRTNPYIFACQQLCDPTPVGQRRLNTGLFHRVPVDKIPKRLYKFMVIDPAGMQTDTKKRGDSWAVGVIGIDPFRDDIGASDAYLLDCVIEPFNELEAMECIVNMYCRAGKVIALGVEKVALSTAEIHIAAALRAKGKHISINSETLVLLRPAGRAKARRIEENLCWPLENGKLHYSAAIPTVYIDRIKMEMDKFPFWHDDALDMMSYVFDMAKGYSFPARAIAPEKKRRDAWSILEDDEPRRLGWLMH
jgi:hypothetical protein